MWRLSRGSLLLINLVIYCKLSIICKQGALPVMFVLFNTLGCGKCSEELEHCLGSWCWGFRKPCSKCYFLLGFSRFFVQIFITPARVFFLKKEISHKYEQCCGSFHRITTFVNWNAAAATLVWDVTPHSAGQCRIPALQEGMDTTPVAAVLFSQDFGAAM